MLKKLLLLLLLIIVFFIGYTLGIGNQKLIYGDSGYPKNCRALITDNIRGFEDGHYTAEESLDSIERNCGQFGLIWHIR